MARAQNYAEQREIRCPNKQEQGELGRMNNWREKWRMKQDKEGLRDTARTFKSKSISNDPVL